MISLKTLKDEIRLLKLERQQRLKTSSWLEVAILTERLETLEFVRDWNEE